MKWHVGCSGYSYREWKDFFYPARLPQRKWFEFYSTHFSTLEINASFYRFPQLKMFQNWYALSPAGFVFSVKAPQSITHYRQFHECRPLLNDLYSVCTAGLKEKMGALLFQFPPRFSYNGERLHRIISHLDPVVVNVLEFRHASWWNNTVYGVLKQAGVVFCGASISGLPDEPVITAPVAYYRFHGIPDLYRSTYTEDQLRTVADAFTGKKKLETVYCYFNNTAEKGAISNATWFENYITGSPGSKTGRELPLPGLFK